MDAAELLKLLRLAQAGGADPAWLRRMSAYFVGLLLDLEQLREAVGPQRLAALERRQRARVLYAQGVPASAIAERLSLSRARVYQLLDNCEVSSSDEILAEAFSETKSD